jgi:hypothetical protein
MLIMMLLYSTKEMNFNSVFKTIEADLLEFGLEQLLI